MTGLIAVSHPDERAANAALAKLADLQRQMLVQVEDAVVVERRGNGKVTLHQSGGSAAARGAAGGALWGGLIGMLFLAPLLGMALGGAMGGATGAAPDTGIDDSFMKDLGDRLAPGKATLVVLVGTTAIDKVLDQMHGQFGGEILQTSLSAADESQLTAAAAPAHAR